MMMRFFRRFQAAFFFGRAAARIYIKKKVVFLTFDDGPSREFTDQILGLLKIRGVRATFFLSGARLEKNPEAGRRIFEGGHDLGNHFYSHQFLIFKSKAFLREGIKKTDALIRHTGYAGPILFRPPHGVFGLLLPWVLRRLNKVTIFWELDSLDYKNPSAGQMVENMIRGVRPGSILLMHDGRAPNPAALEALDKTIGVLQSRGYVFGRLSDFLKDC